MGQASLEIFDDNICSISRYLENSNAVKIYEDLHNLKWVRITKTQIRRLLLDILRAHQQRVIEIEKLVIHLEALNYVPSHGFGLGRAQASGSLANLKSSWSHGPGGLKVMDPESSASSELRHCQWFGYWSLRLVLLFRFLEPLSFVYFDRQRSTLSIA